MKSHSRFTKVWDWESLDFPGNLICFERCFLKVDEPPLEHTRKPPYSVSEQLLEVMGMKSDETSFRTQDCEAWPKTSIEGLE